MANYLETKSKDLSTEERIKQAARTVFYKKGFAATRTRDIAEEADINLALLNYYFRSKAKLFEIIILEALSSFIHTIQVVLNDKETTLETKVEDICNRYIDLILKEPEIPTFIITEIRNNPKALVQKLPIKQSVLNSVFAEQYMELAKQKSALGKSPFHFILNLISLIIFPFVTKPMLMETTGMNDATFKALMLERKQLIPIWIKAMVG